MMNRRIFIAVRLIFPLIYTSLAAGSSIMSKGESEVGSAIFATFAIASIVIWIIVYKDAANMKTYYEYVEQYKIKKQDQQFYKEQIEKLKNKK